MMGWEFGLGGEGGLGRVLHMRVGGEELMLSWEEGRDN